MQSITAALLSDCGSGSRTATGISGSPLVRREEVDGVARLVNTGRAMAVLEEAESGNKEGEQEAGGGDPVAGAVVAAALAKAVGEFLPGRLPVIEDLVQPGIGLVEQAAPL